MTLGVGPVCIDMIDLTSACQHTAEVLAGVTDDQLGLPTPCEKLRLDELIAHIAGWRWRLPPRRARSSPADRHPPTDGAQLDADWRTATRNGSSSWPRRGGTRRRGRA